MLSDKHIFKVVIVISQISIKNIRAVKEKLRKKRFFLFSRGMEGGGYFGLNLRQLTNKKVKYWAFMTT
jgi:hypothetical protein